MTLTKLFWVLLAYIAILIYLRGGSRVVAGQWDIIALPQRPSRTAAGVVDGPVELGTDHARESRDRATG